MTNEQTLTDGMVADAAEIRLYLAMVTQTLRTFQRRLGKDEFLAIETGRIAVQLDQYSDILERRING